MTSKAIIARRLFDGEEWHRDHAVLFSNGIITELRPASQLPVDAEVVATVDLLAPGFIDLQVNGGGGVLLNDGPSVDAISRICAAHARFGTTGLLPTLITDTPAITKATLEAGRAAVAAKVPGFIGLHLEGPHLSVARKGAHDPNLIRPMRQPDLDLMLAHAGAFETLLTTVAPENATREQVRALSDAGVVVSLGHSDTTYAVAVDYARSGARMVTHLFNAMSPFGHREPGVVGAALDDGALYAGLIADGFHVAIASMAVALRAKAGPARIFLVTDAMSTIGTNLDGFTLNGRQIHRRDGRLTLEDGTLAGADIDMLSSVRFVHERIGLPLEEALRMASLYPAQAIGATHRRGALKPGLVADFVALTEALDMESTWIGGNTVFAA